MSLFSISSDFSWFWSFTLMLVVSRMAEPTLVHSFTVPSLPRAVRGVPSKIVTSPKGDLLAYPSAQVVTVLRVADLSVVHVFRGHRFDTTAVRFSRKGELIASGDRNGDVIVWQAFAPFDTKKTCQQCLPGEASFTIADIAWSPDDSKIAVVGNGGSAKYFDIKTGSSGADLSCHSRRIESVAIHPDDKKKTIVVASHDSRISIFDNSKGGYQPKYSKQITTHAKEVYSLSFNADGSLLASGGADGHLGVHNLTTMIDTREHDRPITSTVFVCVPALEEGDTVDDSNQRKEILVYGSTDGTVRAVRLGEDPECEELFELFDEWEIKEVEDPDTPLNRRLQRLGLAASSSAGCVLVVNSNGRLDKIRATDGSLITSLYGHKGHLKAMDVDLTTGVTVTGDNSGVLCIDRGDGAELFGMEGDMAVRGISILSDDGEGVVICLRVNDQMEVLSLMDGSLHSAQALPSEPRGLSRGKDKVAVLCHKHCLLVDTKSKRIFVEEQLTYEPVAVAITPNGLELAIGDIAGNVHIYNIEDWTFTLKHTLKLRGGMWVANVMEYSKNGLYLAVTDLSRYVSVYSREDWKLLVDDWRMHVASIKTVGWSPDGKTLATGAVDRSVIVWRLPQGGKKFDPIVQKSGHIPEVLIWRSATELVTVGEDGCRIHWRLEEDEE